ncbi:MAG TPA: lysophospholipid acyltransferase family protein [Longimicrobiales bacterium]
MRAPRFRGNRGGEDRRYVLGAKFSLTGALAGHILDSILVTCRWDIAGAEHHRRLVEDNQPFILAFWHGRLLPLGYLHRGGGHRMMISLSKDGQYGSALARHWGQVPVRGSSSRRGALALGEMVQAAQAGRTLAFTPDGPRGPRFVVKEGVVVAAQRTGLPILPMSAGASRGWYTRGWDRMLVPKPFSRIRVRYGAPMLVRPDDDLEAARWALESELHRLTALADGHELRPAHAGA